MRLAPSETELFYSAWMPLLHWTNTRRRVVPPFPVPSSRDALDASSAAKVRDALWADDALRHEFVEKNPAALSHAALDLVASWDARLADRFLVARHTSRHSVFMAESKAYAVLGLASPLANLMPPPPCMVDAVLIPFGDRIITDGLVAIYPVTFGGGVRARLKKDLRDATERGLLRTSLTTEVAGGEAPSADPEATNRLVLKAFQVHLRSAGLTSSTAERVLATATKLCGRTAERSVLEVSPDDIDDALGEASMFGDIRATRAGLKRFVRFLRDTERIAHDHASELLDRL